ncbi:hypothetical protein PGT21_033454 [Puccinia graminis f. sp. tritici]|uniref:Uncharacterized protein n=1 Tax=Puccinia graminis f. sp. tritici TaxID=56615 RepID=A0A5B0P2M3_PUCGR|nr:hypothetical protein PGT21_033454 [Puccinia graminis f. sp. tritici]
MNICNGGTTFMMGCCKLNGDQTVKGSLIFLPTPTDCHLSSWSQLIQAQEEPKRLGALSGPPMGPGSAAADQIYHHVQRNHINMTAHAVVKQVCLIQAPSEATDPKALRHQVRSRMGENNEDEFSDGSQV